MHRLIQFAFLASFCSFLHRNKFVTGYETIDVTQTVSAIPCRNNQKCTNKNYKDFFCYTDNSHWERCCNSKDACVVAKRNETYCKTNEDSDWDDERRCRNSPLAITLSGRKCAKDSYCGYYKEKFQWCYIDEEHNKWDHCCYPGSQCTKYDKKDGYIINSCRACKNEGRSCGKNCQRTVCEERDYPCNTAPNTRSVNNYECESPCNQDGTGYAWCWVKPDKAAWDWCCFLGETCGYVYPKDRDGNKTMCYNKNSQRWPMECKVGAAATPLPEDYESPPTPLEEGAITGIVLGIALPLIAILLLVYLRSRCIKQKRFAEQRNQNLEQQRAAERSAAGVAPGGFGVVGGEAAPIAPPPYPGGLNYSTMSGAGYPTQPPPQYSSQMPPQYPPQQPPQYPGAQNAGFTYN